MDYVPRPVDTSQVQLTDSLLELTELLAENTHEVWAQQRLAEGWRWGPIRDDEKKQHPCLVPYDELPESEKEYDRQTALETLKVISALGFSIQRKSQPATMIAEEFEPGQERSVVLEALTKKHGLSLASLLALWRMAQTNDRKLEREAYQLLAEAIIRRGAPLVAYEIVVQGLRFWPQDVRLRQLMALALARSGATQRANELLQQLVAEGCTDEETMGLLARTHKDLAEQAAHPQERMCQLRRAYSGYERAYRATGGYWTGINAATMAILLGETATGQHWARQVRTVCLSELQRVWDANQDPYWVFATLGEAALILENYEEAAKWYRQAAQVGRGRYGDLSSTRRNARLLLSRLRGDVSEVERLLPVPRVAVLSGHRLGSWHGDEQGLRNDEQETFKLAIRERLQERNALIAYASVGCEFDILFCEAVLELKGEIHLVLPCDKDEFFREGVALLPGLDWCDRWEQLLAHAAEVLIASPGPLASSPLMYEYVDLMLYGLSNLRAEQLETELVPFILLDTTLCSPARVPTTLPPYWNSSRHPLEVIDLAHFRDRTALELSPRPPAGLDQGVEVRSADFSGRIMVIMFADAANFGKLTDQAVRRFVEHFMGGIARLVQDSSATPVALNTWGDGLFAIFDTVRAAGNFALELIDFVATQDWTAYELPADLNLRVALHAGPIWACTNPVTGKCDYIGTHVTRAARLEPITPPGHIYASHGFAAIAAAEGVQEFVCEYVGETPLAKGAGMCPTYHVRQKHR